MRHSLTGLLAASIVAMSFALVACTGYPFQTPAETPTPRPFVTSVEELIAHAKERRGELASRASEEPEGIASAAVIMARPLVPAEARAMFAALDIKFSYYIWLQSGTQPEVSGADDWSHIRERQAEYPGLRVIYVNAEGRLSSLQVLANDDRVCLVDLGGTENFYWLARDPGLIADNR